MTPLEKGNVQGRDDTGDRAVGAEAAALHWALLLCRSPGPIWERVGSLEEPLPFHFLIASTVWLQAPGTQTRCWSCLPGGTLGTHPSGECRALSRGQGIGAVTAFWKPKATPRDGNRGPEQLSVQTQAGDGGGSEAPPFPPTPPSACPLEVRSPVVRGERLRSLATAWVWFTVGRKS